MAEEDKIETTNTDQQGISLGYNLFKNYKINWGRYIIFALDNGGEVVDKHPHFKIKLDMINRTIIGVDNSSNYSVGDGDVNLKNSEVELYVDGGPNKCYEGYVVIHCVNEDGSKVWQLNGQWEEFHEKEGEIPDGTSDVDVYEVLENEEDVYQLYELASSSI